MRAGVKEKVASAMERAESLDAQIEAMRTEHAKQLASVNDRCAALERELKEAVSATEMLKAQWQAAEAKADK